MKFKYCVILIAVASIVALYFLSLVSHPALISLSTLSDYNGQQVVVQGMVTDYRTTTFGSQIITLRDNVTGNTSVVLYIEGELLVECGDIIQAIGEVQEYNGQWELSVNNPQFVTIIQRWGNQSYPLWQLAENPARYLDANVNVSGYVTQKQKASFTLTDQTGKYSIDVSYDASLSPQFANGDSVAVAGRFVYEAASLRYTLKATESNHVVWTTEG
jgi:cytochrome c-type biogenesis protein CcmE